MRKAVWAIICLLLLGGAPATQAGQAPNGSAAVIPAAALQTMIDCRIWLRSVQGCLDVPPAAAAAASGVPAPRRSAPGEPDRRGLRRDTSYFLGLQLSIIGVLYFMPESVSGWSDEQKDQHRADKWWDNVTDPTWDDDKHYINYVLHPYWGAAYYVRARERGYGPKAAFGYSYLLSTLYEAGVEALFEPISIQDFFVTPIVGSWVGGHFMRWRDATRERMAATGETRFRDRLLLAATDPLGSAADFVDRRLGRDTHFAAAPFVSETPAWAAAEHDGGTTYGVTFTVRW